MNCPGGRDDDTMNRLMDRERRFRLEHILVVREVSTAVARVPGAETEEPIKPIPLARLQEGMDIDEPDISPTEFLDDVEMRVGEIVSVEEFPEARKDVYKLDVDFGTKTL